MAALKNHLPPPPGTAPNTPGSAAGLHRTDRVLKTESTSPPAFHLLRDGPTLPTRPRPEGARRAARTRTCGGPAHSAAPAAAALRGRTHHHLLEDALQLRLHGHHGDRHGAGPGPAGPFVRRRRWRPPLLPRRAGSSVPDAAPREAPARLGRSGQRRPAPLPATGGESNSVLKLGSDLVLFSFSRKYSLRLLLFLKNLFFE